MLSRIRRHRPVDIILNLVFVVWVLYFVVTGYIIPKPLVRHAVRPPVIEQQQQQLDPAPELAPVLTVDQDS